MTTTSPLSARSLAAATPDTRDRYADFLRVFSIAVVVFGHWLMAVVTVGATGRIAAGNALTTAPALQYATRVLQVMPLFFGDPAAAPAHGGSARPCRLADRSRRAGPRPGHAMAPARPGVDGRGGGQRGRDDGVPLAPDGPVPRGRRVAGAGLSRTGRDLQPGRAAEALATRPADPIGCRGDRRAPRTGRMGDPRRRAVQHRLHRPRQALPGNRTDRSPPRTEAPCPLMDPADRRPIRRGRSHR